MLPVSLRKIAFLCIAFIEWSSQGFVKLNSTSKELKYRLWSISATSDKLNDLTSFITSKMTKKLYHFGITTLPVEVRGSFNKTESPVKM
ncbi:hypothetical protein LguiA_007295 [Lonicera macranthoides]